MTGRAIEILFPPKRTSGLPVLSRPATFSMWTSSAYSPRVTTFLTVPLLRTRRFLSSSVTWSTNPAVTFSISSRVSDVGTPTRTGVCGIPLTRGSLTASSPTRSRSASRSFSRTAISAFSWSGFSRSLRQPPSPSAATAREAATARRGAHLPPSFFFASAFGFASLSLSPFLSRTTSLLVDHCADVGGIRVARLRRVLRLHEVAGGEVDRDPQHVPRGDHRRDGHLDRHRRPVDPDGTRRDGRQVDALLELHRDLRSSAARPSAAGGRCARPRRGSPGAGASRARPPSRSRCGPPRSSR